MENKDKISADNLFSNLNYYKIFYENGFFWHNHETDKCVSFNLKKKEWEVYDYDTGESRQYGDELLKAILLQELELNWLSWKEYKAELQSI